MMHGVFHGPKIAGMERWLLLFLLVPLAYMRKKERPKRMFSTWCCDILRLLIAYSLADVALFMAIGAMMGGPHGHGHPGHRDGRFHGPHGPPGPPPGPPMGHFGGPHGPPPPFGPPHGVAKTTLQRREFELQWWYDVGLEMDSRVVILRALDIVPGVVIMDRVYKGVLMGIRKFRGLSKRQARECGLVSGSYGWPVDLRWVLLQSLILSVSILATRLLMFGFLHYMGNGATSLTLWVRTIPSPFAQQILIRFLLPFVLYMAHILLTDYLTKHPPKRADIESCNHDGHDDIELSTLRRPMSPIGSDEPTVLPIEIGLGPGRSRSARPPATVEPIEHASVPSVPPVPPAAPLAQSVPLSAPQTAPQSAPRQADEQVDPCGSQGVFFGMVTASLLNTAAARATSSAITSLSPPSPSPSPSSSSSSLSVAGQDQDSIAPEPSAPEQWDPAGLPSYDDSERQHQEMLRGPRALEHLRIIQALKE
uniref:ARAD1B07832p n=1 Tax=Blastobotrys adeninivorans TaxID=409370 RepID=A0A060T629_BLAAD